MGAVGDAVGDIKDVSGVKGDGCGGHLQLGGAGDQFGKEVPRRAGFGIVGGMIAVVFIFTESEAVIELCISHAVTLKIFIENYLFFAVYDIVCGTVKY
jgi:hypothetical protein